MASPNWPTTIPIPEATGQYLSPDTTTTKRIDFTDFFLRFTHAEDAHPAYKTLFTTHQTLIKLLVEHPAMAPNLQQTFSTPANSKNKVYFMWDFALRSFQHLAAEVSPQDPWSSPMFQDVLGRALMAKEMVLDESGNLGAGIANPGNMNDGGVDFGEEIKKVAAKLDDLGEGCAGCGKAEKEGGGELLCARCKRQRYCSGECQKKCWKAHKKGCKA
ncbi:hypothetical protein T440DRAFT_464460 [Plenodomus tracheiphilus IPT5]|uniref:MYND-type domain-containing protein n=1 Tax=Plenodomus tracheiphilus IPT5 TaxID=1408161 RepID=A0A6A7BI91_9PLEO|nr:hypothetical protein T440DRAFT_464460 [Plenodomus tracheiphilus IPT5]